jgi:regulator of replication initiation timing
MALSIGAFIAALTFWFARRSGLQPVQAELIDNLQDNAKALSDQVNLLREQLKNEIEQRQHLERKVTILQQAIVDLAAENSTLRKRLGMPPREEGVLP